MTRLNGAFVTVLAAVALAGCHHGLKRVFAAKECNKPHSYDSARSIPPLRVPLGVDQPDTHAALRIPPLNEPAPPARKLTDPCLDEPPLYATPQSRARTVPLS